ncbi:MAG: hypothetical protein ACKN89_07000 [Cyanobium sp.]
MFDEQTIKKLEDWVRSNPDSADTPFLNVSTGQEYTVRTLLSNLQASVTGNAVLSDTTQAELNQLETWIGGL